LLCWCTHCPSYWHRIICIVLAGTARTIMSFWNNRPAWS